MSLLRPPMLRTADGESTERHATWTELFFDLIFVVAVAQLGHELGAHLDWTGVAVFVGLFVVVWWAWVGHTVLADRFDSDDVLHRVLSAVQMLAIAAMALYIGKGVGDHATSFVLAYVSFRAILILLNLRVYRHVPPARPLLGRYLSFFAPEAALWLLSLLVPAPARYALWAIGTAGVLVMPLTARRQQSRARLDSGHLTERFGLFTIIVLGESVLGVVDGAVSQEQMAVSSLLAAALAFAAAFSFWWIYFDNANERVTIRFTDEPEPRAALTSQIWVYIHLPLAAALTAFGVAIEHVVAHDPGSPLADAERWLLCGAAAVALVSLGLIHLDTEGRAARVQAGAHIAGGALALLLGLLGGGLLPVVLTAAIAALGAMQVIVDLGVERAYEREGEERVAAPSPDPSPTA